VATRRGVRPLATTRSASVYTVKVGGIGGGSATILAHDAIDAITAVLRDHRESLTTFNGKLTITVEYRKADTGAIYIGPRRGR
jgi:hypothetical protein